MEISMGHGNFHGPWKFPGPGIFHGPWKFPVAYLLGGLEVPSISEWFETITFKERSKGEHYRIQLKFVALRKLSLSIERLKIEHFWSQFKFVALFINTNKYHYGLQWPLLFKNLCAKRTSWEAGNGNLEFIRKTLNSGWIFCAKYLFVCCQVSCYWRQLIVGFLWQQYLLQPLYNGYRYL